MGMGMGMGIGGVEKNSNHGSNGPVSLADDPIVVEFHKRYYYSGVWSRDTKWMGYSVQKCPLDLWVYQELIHRLRPGVIIETGTCFGGSALFLAHICDTIQHGRVVTIDVAGHPGRPVHPRIQYFKGSSVSPEILARVAECVQGRKVVMIILDSDHREEHVAKELLAFAPFVSVGSYMIVEDTNINGRPVYPTFGPGPAEAVAKFLDSHSNFKADIGCEKFLMTQNPGGYLKRLS